MKRVLLVTIAFLLPISCFAKSIDAVGEAVIYNNDIADARYRATQQAIKQAVLESGSRVNIKDELYNGELESNLEIRSSGYVQKARILSEEQNGDFLTVVARVDVTPDSQCSTGPTSYYKKTVGVTGFELQVPQQARLGELSNISRELPKDLADEINKQGYLRALTATNIAIYPDIINAPSSTNYDGSLTNVTRISEQLGVQYIISGVIRDIGELYLRRPDDKSAKDLLDEEIDKDLNEQFNKACEQAFAPCRLFYAEQDKIRANHLSNRLTIIDETQVFTAKFDDSNVNWKSIDGKVNQLKQKWRDAGEIDRDKYQSLNKQFNTLLKPIKLAIHQHHLDNSIAKNKLITKAEQALENDDIQLAINNVKQLQNQWKEIGYSGPKDENRLWQRFRSINDQVFKRRNEEQNQQKEQQSQLTSQYFETINDIEQRVLADKNIKSIKIGKERSSEVLKSAANSSASARALANSALCNSNC